MKHTINVRELIEWKNEQLFMYASSSSENKRLYITGTGGYVVKKDGKVVAESEKANIAVEVYNSL